MISSKTNNSSHKTKSLEHAVIAHAAWLGISLESSAEDMVAVSPLTASVCIPYHELSALSAIA